MKKLLSVTVGMLLCSTTLSYAESEIVEVAYNSALLDRDVTMQVYLPDGYDATQSDKYPVIYMLHGASGSNTDWLVKGGIKVTADQLMKRGELRDSVIVMPTFGPSTWYTDGNAEKAETAFVEEFIPYIEKTFNVREDRAGRSVGGLSMGGYGALNLSLSHPELFCAAGVLSPAIYDPLPPETSTARQTAQFVKDNQFDEKAWGDSLYTARLNNYYQKDLVVPIWIESGDHDSLGIVLAAAKLYWTLHTYQPEDVEYRVIDGDHDWMVFRDSSIRALPYMSQKCEALK
ncbi:esterase [Ignatzschineria indica]|uniref:alpha/beta hydrolase n=1 Tax=Ignatzschineria indica TaxID=472583 RepID=UPI002576E0A8|nr:alpha/beta hydrolase-fold protein [Ignatzschineria indica]MDM1545656.1 esterase [Ignatzschineria indica]